jgi:hypothetical protein
MTKILYVELPPEQGLELALQVIGDYEQTRGKFLYLVSLRLRHSSVAMATEAARHLAQQFRGSECPGWSRAACRGL